MCKLCNWNSGKKEQSLKFFHDLGYSQISSPYYVQQNIINIRDWRIAQEKYSTIKGMMYTTWSGDYTFLTPFAYYAWGAGPTYIFTPLDSIDALKDSLTFAPIIQGDIYDKNDVIDSASITLMFNQNNLVKSITYKLSKLGSPFVIRIPNFFLNLGIDSCTYTFKATNKQGITNTSPTYFLNFQGQTSVEEVESTMQIQPNPIKDVLEIIVHTQPLKYEIIDVLGAVIQYGMIENEKSRISISTSPNGVYILTLSSPYSTVISKKIIVDR